MCCHKKIIFSICLCLTAFQGFSQKPDSLKHVLLESNKEHQPRVLNEIANYYFHNIKDTSFISIVRIINEKFGDLPELASIYHNIGKLHMEKKQYEKAFVNLKQAMIHFEQHADEKGLAIVKTDIAIVHSRFFDFDVAINYLFEAIRFYKTTEDAPHESSSMIVLGDVYFQLEQFGNAFEMYSQALAIKENLADSLEIAGAYFRIAKTYFAQKNYENSFEFYEKALKIYQNLDNSQGIADVYYETGNVYRILGNFQEAGPLYEKSIRYYEKISNIRGLAQSYLSLSKFYHHSKNKERVFYFLNEALYAAEYGEEKDLLVEVYRELSLFYEHENVYREAMENYKKYANLKDSLSLETISLKFAQVKSKFDNQAKSETIKKLEADSFFKDQALRKQRSFLIASILSALLALVIVLLLFKARKRWQKINIQLTEKNQKLKKAEEKLLSMNYELHKSEKRLKEIVQNMPVLVAGIDHEGTFIFWNKTCETVTGHLADEVVGNSGFSKYLIENVKKMNDLSLKRGGENILASEYELITKSGEKRDIVWTSMSKIFPVLGWADWQVGIDVTERNLFAKKLERETAILNSILNSIPYPIFYKNTEGVYQRANQGFYDLHGLHEDELLGKNDLEVFAENDAKKFIARDIEILQTQKSSKELRWLKNASGEDKLFDTIKMPLYNTNNELIGVVGISFDMTKRFHIEEELKKQKEKAEEADRLKSAFLANMSHEIRSPMNAIIGFSNLISDSFEPESELASYMDYIKQSGANLLQLVDDIIDIAKLEAGQLKIRKEKFDVDQMLEKLKIAVENSSGKQKKPTVEIRLKRDPDNQQTIINSDELRIKQVINNFISNAIKFTDDGFIEFGYERMPNNELLFYTKDTGIGIAPADQELIFDRFGQVKDTYTRNTSGTGLGLAISKSIVELLKGEIWLDSKENIGSTFYFKIPVEYSLQKPEIKEEPEYKKQDFNWSNRQILVVEDDDMNYKVIKSILARTKVRIIRVENGREAVDLALSDIKFDLVIMDIQLPVLNGYDATRQIRGNKDIPVIAVTAYAMPGEKEKSIEAGCKHFITKPFNRNELLHKISGSFAVT
jgi:PAS domain S-box-containing protein